MASNATPQSQNLMSFSVQNGLLPAALPRALELELTLLAGITLTLDLKNLVPSGIIEWVQCVFIDNSSNNSILTIVSQTTNQKISMPPFSQGYLPLLTPNDPVLFVTSGSNSNVQIEILTAPYPAAIWSTLQNSCGISGTTNNNGQFPLILDHSCIYSAIQNAGASVILPAKTGYRPVTLGLSVSLTANAASAINNNYFYFLDSSTYSQNYFFTPTAGLTTNPGAINLLNDGNMYRVGTANQSVQISLAGTLTAGYLNVNFRGGYIPNSYQ